MLQTRKGRTTARTTFSPKCSSCTKTTAFMNILLIFVSLFYTNPKSSDQKCVYFMPFNWAISYPETFSAQFDPAASTATITSAAPNFAGITSISVVESLNCNYPAECTFRPRVAITSQASIPPAFFDCAQNAQPLFLLVCFSVLHSS